MTEIGAKLCGFIILAMIFIASISCQRDSRQEIQQSRGKVVPPWQQPKNAAFDVKDRVESVDIERQRQLKELDE